MAALLHIAGIETEVIRRDYCVVRVRIENIGTRIAGPGVLIARQTSEDGSVKNYAADYAVYAESFPCNPRNSRQETRLRMAD